MLDKKVERISLCVLGLDDMSDGKQQNENILKKKMCSEKHILRVKRGNEDDKT
jgi:hypothetical protein